MKTLKLSILLSAAVLLFCAPSIFFNIVVPASIDLPSEIKNVAIIDRSQSENNVVNVLEKGLISTLSGKGDRISKSCIEGLADQLNVSGEIRPVITGIVEKRAGTALDLPEPMQWFEIEQICKESNADALISLEIFSRQYIEYVAEVKVGFRIYDPGKKQIIDEFQYFHGINTSNAPVQGNPDQLLVNILNNDDALKQASFIAGTIYGKRISPFEIRVKRDYYKRSKRDPKLAEGARMMEVNNWDAAINAFLQAIEHGHRKTKGRAAHNLAIVYEITGDLDLAFASAQDGWGKYGNKASREYSLILEERINEIAILQSQQKN